MVCITCKRVLPEESFAKNNSRKSGRQNKCRDCMKKYRASRKDDIKKMQARYYRDNKDKMRNYMKFYHYGVTPEDWEKMFEGQKGCCAICGRHQSELTKTLCIDHDHTTSKVRGLLCLSCNRGIGYLQDDPDLLDKASQYLKESF